MIRKSISNIQVVNAPGKRSANLPLPRSREVYESPIQATVMSHIMMGRRASRFDPQAGRPAGKHAATTPREEELFHELQVFHPPGVPLLSVPRSEGLEVLPVLLVPALFARLRRQLYHQKQCEGLLILHHSPYRRGIRLHCKDRYTAGVREITTAISE